MLDAQSPGDSNETARIINGLYDAAVFLRATSNRDGVDHTPAPDPQFPDHPCSSAHQLDILEDAHPHDGCTYDTYAWRIEGRGWNHVRLLCKDHLLHIRARDVHEQRLPAASAPCGHLHLELPPSHDKYGPGEPSVRIWCGEGHIDLGSSLGVTYWWTRRGRPRDRAGWPP